MSEVKVSFSSTLIRAGAWTIVLGLLLPGLARAQAPSKSETMAPNKKLEHLRALRAVADISLECLPLDSQLDENQRELVRKDLLRVRDMIDAGLLTGETWGLESIEANLLTAWNEVPLEDSAVFWRKVAEKGLPFKRRDRMKEILVAGRIKNHTEYDMVVDTVDDAVKSGRITQSDAAKLNAMLRQFEKQR